MLDTHAVARSLTAADVLPAGGPLAGGPERPFSIFFSGGAGMASTHVGIQRRAVWSVEAKCVDESAVWRFDDRDDAEWFGAVVEKNWRARCPRCGYKNALNLQLERSAGYGWEALAVCGYDTCSFAARFVSWGEPVDHPLDRDQSDGSPAPRERPEVAGVDGEGRRVP